VLQLLKSLENKLPSELHNKNPIDQVPVLECRDNKTNQVITLTQSLAIIEFLQEISDSGASLLPADHIQRARCRQVRLTVIALMEFVYLW
jgi:glutathione S-transferase